MGVPSSLKILSNWSKVSRIPRNIKTNGKKLTIRIDGSRITWERWHACYHFDKNTSDSPHIQWGWIFSASKENIWVTEETLILSYKQVSSFILPGGRYHSVTTSCEYVWLGTLFARANPKSANFNSPISLISKFCGFTSRCRTRRLWQ